MTHPSEDARPPYLRSISPDATPEEVAAIVAAIEQCLCTAPSGDRDRDQALLGEWVHASRLGARGAGLQRGSWRISGRLGRRSRA
jgi:hypothetical protein